MLYGLYERKKSWAPVVRILREFWSLPALLKPNLTGEEANVLDDKIIIYAKTINLCK